MKKIMAFTLAETLAVLAIISLSLGLGIPGLLTFVENQRIDNTSSRLAQTFRVARAQAIEEGRITSVCPIDVTTEACISNVNWDAWKIYYVDNGTAIKIFNTISPGIVTADTTSEVRFSTIGTTDSGYANTFTLTTKNCTGDNGKSVAVTISGFIQVEKIAC